MTYVKRWAAEAQEDLRLFVEAVRIRVRRTATFVAAAPHTELARIDADTGLRVRPVDGTLLEMYYQPNPSDKTVTIAAIRPQADPYGDPYADLV